MRIFSFKRLTVGLLVILVLYISSYGVLSALGGYRFDQSGRVRYGFGFATSDIMLWHPKYGWFQPNYMQVDGKIETRGDALGYFYGPLIWLDRKLVHKTEIIDAFKKYHEQ